MPVGTKKPQFRFVLVGRCGSPPSLSSTLQITKNSSSSWSAKRRRSRTLFATSDSGATGWSNTIRKQIERIWSCTSSSKSAAALVAFVEQPSLCSRHPNYFGEWMVWNSLIVTSLPSLFELWQTPEENLFVKAGVTLGLFMVSYMVSDRHLI